MWGTTLGPTRIVERSDHELLEFGMPLLCHISHLDQLKLADFAKVSK